MVVMDLQQILHMKGGEGHNSYFKNSLCQKEVILKAKPVLEKTILELCCSRLPDCIRVADLGCSSGPNALLPVREIIETIDTICCRLNAKPPTLQVFLNDLPGNDFNTIFRSIPSFYEKLEKEKGDHFANCFIAGIPGSFHERLFPDSSIHIFHSSFAVHFLSQPPEGLTSECGEPLNKGKFCIAKTSPPSARRAYVDQFGKDFIRFLKLRSQEVIPGGYIVCSLMGRTNDMDDPSCKNKYEMWDLIGTTLNDMVKEGLLEESALDKYNFPIYAPSAEEIRHLIEMEGSFHIEQFEAFDYTWDANIGDGNKDLVFDKHERGKHVAVFMSAVAEPFLARHFGNAIVDGLFERFALKVVDYLEMGTGVFHNLASIIKK